MTSHLVCNLGREILWKAKFILPGLDLYHYITMFGGREGDNPQDSRHTVFIQTMCCIISKCFHVFSDFIFCKHVSALFFFLCPAIHRLSKISKFACYRAPCPEAAGMARRWRLEFDAASDVAEAMLRSLRLMTKK